MFGRALTGVLLIVVCALSLAPGLAVAQDPDPESAVGPACVEGAIGCVAGVRPQAPVRIIPSAQGEFADGHADPSSEILVALALASFAGLVVSVLNRMALDDGPA
jgi:hypothetical protein